MYQWCETAWANCIYVLAWRPIAGPYLVIVFVTQGTSDFFYVKSVWKSNDFFQQVRSGILLHCTHSLSWPHHNGCFREQSWRLNPFACAQVCLDRTQAGPGFLWVNLQTTKPWHPGRQTYWERPTWPWIKWYIETCWTSRWRCWIRMCAFYLHSIPRNLTGFIFNVVSNIPTPLSKPDCIWL